MPTKDFKGVVRPTANKAHGTRSNYRVGCRCLLCRAANSRYESERRAMRQSGEWNCLVPATRARRHILNLSKHNVGRRAISAASDVSATIIFEIKRGRRATIRKSTQDRILAVTRLAVSDAALVPAANTWRQLNTLLAEGFSKAELARRLGLRSGSLQLGKEKVLARNAVRVDRFYRLLMRE